MASRETVIFDACSLINVYASQISHQILTYSGRVSLISENAQREAQFIHGGNPIDSRRTRDPIDWSQLISSGDIQIINDISEEEASLYLNLSMRMGDGEAMTGAIAYHRAIQAVSDDAKAIAIMESMSIATVSSLELLENWSREQAAPRELLRTVLLDIRYRAKFVPGRNHPLYSWWSSIMGEPFD